jgi:hypothetical protein
MALTNQVFKGYNADLLIAAPRIKREIRNTKSEFKCKLKLYIVDKD